MSDKERLVELAEVGERDGHPIYDVLVCGQKIGCVVGFNPTFDRKPRGQRYVTKRWTSTKRYWRVEAPGWSSGHRSPYETRKRAVEVLVARAYQIANSLSYTPAARHTAGESKEAP